jgi:hypothetical protein
MEMPPKLLTDRECFPGSSILTAAALMNGLGEPMRVISDSSINRRRSLAILVLIAGTLAGCGGGGGGGGVNPGPGVVAPVVPTLNAATTGVEAFSAAHSLDTSTNKLTSVAPGGGGGVTINMNFGGAGIHRLTIAGVSHPPPSAPESTFSFTITPASLAPGQNVNGTGCTGCFRTGVATDSGGRQVTIIDLDPAALGGMNYSTMGLWSTPSTVLGNTNKQVGGAYSFGVLTRGQDLPTTTTATYSGVMIGTYADGTSRYRVGASATAFANFTGSVVQNVSGNSVFFSTTGSFKESLPGSPPGPTGPDPFLDLSGTLTITRSGTTNSLSSAVNGITSRPGAPGAPGHAMSGDAKGAFFGPTATTAPFAPPELGGGLAVQNTDGSKSMTAGFALKKQP